MKIIFDFIVLTMITLFSFASAWAAPGITYHGQILKPNSQPVEGQFVGFRIRVMDGDTGSCVMYEETHTKDMRNSNGAFAIAIGSGSVVGTYNVSSVSYFDQLFLNNRTFNFSSPAGCAATPYTPDVRDGRKLNVDFRESPTDPWESMPVMDVAYVPFAYNALVANQVGQHTSGSLLRVETAGTPSAATALTPANFTELLALLNGTTTQYIKTVSGTAGQVTVSTTSGAATVGLADVATVTAGTYGSATQVPVFTVDAKGRVTSVTNTAITGAGGGITQLTGDVTASGTGSVSATIANNAITTVKIADGNVTGPKLAASAVGSAAISEGAITTGKIADSAITTAKLADGSVTNVKLAADSVTSAKIQNGTITGDDLAATASLNIASVSATGNVGAETMSSRLMALYEQSVNGTDYVGLKAPDNITTGIVVFTLPSADGTAGQVLRTDGSGNLSWVNAASGAGDFMADGTVPMTGQLRFIGGSAGTPGLGVVGDTNTGVFSPGADSLAITTGGTERLRVDASGNVGIGTTSAAAKLNVSSGNILIDGSSQPSMLFDSSVGSSGFLGYNGASQFVVNNDNAGADIIRFQSSGADRVVIQGSGNVGIGTNNPGEKLQVQSDNDWSTIASVVYSSTHSPALVGYRARGVASAPLIVQNGDITNIIQGWGYDGSQLRQSGVIQFEVDGTPGAGDMPGRMVFFTTPDGSFTPSERMRITNSGNIGIGNAAPTAALHLKAGTTAAGTAPLKLTAGPVMTTPEAGAIEFDGTSLFYTDSGNTRRTLGVSGAGITALTGDVLASGVGSAAAVIANDAVTSAKILDGTIATADLADDAVTFAKIQNIASGSILGRASSSAGNIEELTLGSGLTLTGTVLNATASDTFSGLPCGDGFVPYRSSATWGCREVTSTNANNTIVTRDGSGNFIAGSGTYETSLVLKDGSVGGAITMAAPTAFTSYNLTLPTTAGSSGQVLSTNGAGILSWISPVASGTGFVQNGNSFGALATLGTNDTFGLALETNGTERMRIDASGNVGIGTTSPTAKLHIVDGATPGETSLRVNSRVEVSGDGRILWGSSANQGLISWDTGRVMMGGVASNDLVLTAGGTEWIRVLASGNVGIGTNNPTIGRLQINQSTDTSNSAVTIVNSAGTTGMRIWTDSSGNGSIDVASGGTNPLILNRGGGLVGIGTTSPARLLHVHGPMRLTASATPGTPVAGDIYIDASDSNKLKWYDGTVWQSAGSSASGAGSGDFLADGTIPMTGQLRMIAGDATTPGLGVVGDTNTGIFSPLADALSFTTGGTERLRINSSGNVGIGIAMPSSKLHVDGAIQIKNNDNITWGGTYGPGIPTIAGATSDGLFFYPGGSTSGASMLIKNDGKVGIGTTSPTATLDVYGASGTASIHVGTNGTLTSGGSLFTIQSNTYPLILQSATSTVGIGTTSPSANLHVSGSGNTTARIDSSLNTGYAGTSIVNNGSGQLDMTVYGTTNGGTLFGLTTNNQGSIYGSAGLSSLTVGTAGTSPLVLGTNNLERVRISSTGNVGIGTTNPGQLLHISGSSTSSTNAFLRLQNTSNSAGNLPVGLDFVSYSGSGNNPAGRIYGVYDSDNYSQSRLTFQTTAGSSSYVDVMSLKNGNVGIGTTSPARLLHVHGPMRLTASSTPGAPVAGDIYIDASDSNKLKWYDGTVWQSAGSSASGAGSGDFLAAGTVPMTGQLRMIAGDATTPGLGVVGDTNTGIFSPLADVLSFTTGGSERLRVSSSGSVGIGTTAPESRLHIEDNASIDILIKSAGALTRPGISGYQSAGTVASPSATGLNDVLLFFGGRGYGTSTYGTVSDAAILLRAAQNFTNTSKGTYIQFETTTNNTTTRSERMRIDQNGNVGIGTTTPSRLLHVAGPMRLTASTTPASPAAGDIFIDSAASNVLKYHNGTGWVSLGGGGSGDFMADGSVAMTGQLKVITGSDPLPGIAAAVDLDTGIKLNTNNIQFITNGNMVATMTQGTGVTFISTPVTVQSSSLDATILRTSADGSATAPSLRLNDTNSGLFTAAADVIGLATGGSERLRISSSGSVAIGTTTPNATLTVQASSTGFTEAISLRQGTAAASGHGPMLSFYGDTGTANMGYLGFQFNAASNASTNLILANRSAGTVSEKMRIDASGQVGIGTTTPRSALDVNGTVLMKPAVLDTTSPIDFSTGNLQYTTGNCAAFALHNMRDGGSYTFAVQGATSALCSFTAFSDAGSTGLTVKMPPDHAATTASKHTLYTFLVMGTTVYVTWMPGL